MKANPMETAPKDGRFVNVLVADTIDGGLEIRKARWEDEVWKVSAGLCRTCSPYGWIEDIEPPVQKELKLDEVCVRFWDDGDGTIGVQFRTSGSIYFSKRHIPELIEWLKQLDD